MIDSPMPADARSGWGKCPTARAAMGIAGSFAVTMQEHKKNTQSNAPPNPGKIPAG